MHWVGGGVGEGSGSAGKAVYWVGGGVGEVQARNKGCTDWGEAWGRCGQGGALAGGVREWCGSGTRAEGSEVWRGLTRCGWVGGLG